jgi:hypothetical protein
MKLKLDTVLFLADDSTHIKNEQGKPLTLKDVCISSILMPTQEDDEKKKFEKWEVFKKLRNEDDLSIEDVALIKKCIGKFQPQLIMGQCFELLENS